MNRAELKELLSQDYHYDHWLKIYEYLFSEVEFFNEPSAIEHNETEKIEQFRQIGFVTLKDDSKIALFEVKVASGIQIPRNRVYLNNVISRWIAGGGFYEAAIGIFYAEGQPDYRFTFAMRGAKFTEDMKVEEVKTNPKRYTYVLGKNEKCETAARRFEELSKNGVALTLSNVEDAFSVEKLNKEFFSKVSDSFYKLVGGTVEKESFDHVLRLPGVDYEVDKKNSQKHQKFAVRLIGRIVFCWFLKFKKSEAGKPLIPEDLLSTKAIKGSSNYYHDILEKLFFECLNTPIEQRRPDILPNAKGIPFLNGGLFEPQSNGDYYELQEIVGHYQSKYYATLTIPNDWFMTFFETLEQYNFTIDENSIFDVDVSVDPEMLGRIFENLLAEINPETGETARKSTGSFYTPREIVDYMVDQSLIECLKIKTGLDTERLQRLFSYQEQILDEKVKFSDVEKRKISDALHQIKALDPACGSGAFPMGILHKMLYALSQVDPDSQMWYEQQIAGVTDFKLKENLLAKFKEENVPYIHKLGIINHCVYGVDIQPIAIEISKLRFFLSLVVDEKINDLAPNRGVKPLPNLDFKFVAANTLIPAPGNHGKSKPKDTLNLGDEKEEVELGFANIDPFFLKFDEFTEKYFYADNKESKTIIRAKLEAIVNEKVDEKQREIDTLINGMSASKHAHREVLKQRHKREIEGLQREQELWDSYLNIFKGESVDFFEPRYFFPEAKDGFDIVIGNPPYVQLRDMPEHQHDILLTSTHLDVAKGGRLNMFQFFISHAVSICKKNGIIAMITQNSILGEETALNCRKFIFSNCKVLEFSSFPERDNASKRVFEGVKMSVCISIMQKVKVENFSFKLKIWEERQMINHSQILLSKNDIIQIFPSSYQIPLVTQRNINLLKKIRNKKPCYFINSNAGEIDMTKYQSVFKTNAKYRVVHGAQVQRYYISNAPSQGKINYLDNQDILANNRANELLNKKRIVMQRITGVDSDIRLIMTIIDNNFLCSNSTNYILDEPEGLSLEYTIGILNSKLINKYFKITSTNTNITTKEINNIPLPIPPNKKIEISIERLVKIILGSKKREESTFFERLIDAMVYELYFPNEIKSGAAEVLKHLTDLPELEKEADEKSMKVIEKIYNELSAPKHPIAAALLKLHNIEEINIIEDRA